MLESIVYFDIEEEPNLADFVKWRYKTYYLSWLFWMRKNKRLV